MRADYFKLGLFVIAAVSIAVIAVIILGAGVLFRDEILVETYFVESVQGLNVGSPVTFRGVPIGRVEQITLTGNVYATPRRYALVRSALLSDVFMVENDERGWQEEIDKGLRFRLAVQGITAAYYLEADYVDPSEFPVLEFEWKPRRPYIPAVPSTYTRLTDAIENVARSFDRMNVEKIAGDLETSLNALSEILQDIDVQKIGGQTEKLITELRATNRQIRELLTGDLPDSLQQLESTFGGLNELISRQQRDIEATVNNFRRASENLRQLSEDVKRYPSQLFFGEPPSPSGVRR